MPSTASGGGLSVVGRTPRTRGRGGGSTWTADSNWRPSPNTRKGWRPPLREICAPSLGSTKSGRWRWADNCCPTSALRRKFKQRTQPLYTASPVFSAAPSCNVWGTLEGPDPPRAKTGNRHPRAREAAPLGLSRPVQHSTAMPCPLQPVTGSGRAPHRRPSAPSKSRRPAGGLSKNRGGTAADMRRHTPAQKWHGPHGGQLVMGRQRGTPGTASPHERPRGWSSTSG